MLPGIFEKGYMFERKIMLKVVENWKRKKCNSSKITLRLIDILLEGSRDPSFVFSFGLFLWKEPKASERGRLSRLCGALFCRRWCIADGFPQGATAACPFAIRTSGSILFLILRAGSFRAGVVVDPFTTRRLLNDTTLCCLPWFLCLLFG